MKQKTLTRRFVCILMTLTMLIFAVPLPTGTVSADNLSDMFPVGSGTENDPYLVSTPKQLIEIIRPRIGAKDTAVRGYFQLINDIDLSGTDNSWQHLSQQVTYTDTYYFMGVFDGGGYTISGLNMDLGEESGIGLFRRAVDSVIKDLNVIGSIRGKDVVGGIVGLASDSKILRCTFSGTADGESNVGGIAGNSYESEISNCINYGSITASVKNAGGIAGWCDKGEIMNCANQGSVRAANISGGISGYLSYSTAADCYNDVSAVIKGNEYVGGITGQCYGSSLSSCYNTGTVEGSGSGNYTGGIVGGVLVPPENESNSSVHLCNNLTDIKGGANVGGIIGRISDTTAVSNCKNTGNITAEGKNVGGISGENNGTVSKCSSTGNISAGGSRAGGIAGKSTGAIEESCNTGTVTLSGEIGDGAGIAGYLDGGRIVKCYNTASVTGDEASCLGGIAGSALSGSSVTDSYNTGSIKGYNKVGGIFGQSFAGTSLIHTFTAPEDNPYASRENGWDYKIIGYYDGGEEYPTMERNYYSNGSSQPVPWDFFNLQNSEWYSYIAEINMDKQSNFIDWDFNGVWKMGEDHPELRCFDYINYFSNRITIEEQARSPYRISNKEQLLAFAEKVNSGDNFNKIAVFLLSDIDLTGTAWTPIGNAGQFDGTFVGGGHIISGLECSTSSSDAGFFGDLGPNAVVQDLGVTGSVSCTAGARRNAGGIAGSNSGTIVRCAFHGDISSSSGDTGGIAGLNSGSILDCYHIGKVTATAVNPPAAGGVVGRCADNYNVQHSFHYGQVNGSALKRTGGVFGECGDIGNFMFRMKYCFSAGTGDLRAGGYLSDVMHNYDFESSALTLTDKELSELHKSDVAGWDFENTWAVGLKMPRLRSLSKPVVFDRNDDLYGFTYTGIGEKQVTYYIARNGEQLGPDYDSVSGWSFIGWNTEPKGSGSFYARDDLFVPAAATLYAQWISDNEVLSLKADKEKIDLGTIAFGEKPADAVTVTLSNNGTRILEAAVSAPWDYRLEGFTKGRIVIHKDDTDDQSFTVSPGIGLYPGDHSGEITVTGTYENKQPFVLKIPLSYTVSKIDRKPELSIEGWTYGEAPNEPVLTGSGKVTYEYISLDEGSAAAYSGDVPTDAGSYRVRATVAQDDIYNSCTAEADFTISPADQTVTAPEAKELTYNGSKQTLIDPAGCTTGTVLYSLSKDGTYSAKLPAAKNAGKYTVWYYAEGSRNYNASAKKSLTVTVKPAKVTVKAEDAWKWENEEDPGFKAEVTGLYGKDTVTYTVSREEGTAPGSYDITASGEALQGNYSVTYEKGTFNIFAINITDVALNSTDAKKDYFEGEELAISGLSLTVTKNNGDSENVTVTADMVSGFDSSTPGTQTITVSYEGFKNTYSVKVTAIAITDVTLNSGDAKKDYFEGEELDISGLTLTVTKNNGDSENVTVTSDMVSGFDSSVPGTQTVTVSYAGFENTFEVDIAEKKAVVYTSDTAAVIYKKGSGETVILHISRSFDDELTFGLFEKLTVDDLDVDALLYTKEAGSLLLTLSPELLETLEVGSHDIIAVFTDGTAAIDLIAEEADPTDSEDESSDSEDESSDSEDESSDSEDESSDSEDDSSDSESEPADSTESSAVKPTPTDNVPNTNSGSSPALILIGIAGLTAAIAAAFRKKQD